MPYGDKDPHLVAGTGAARGLTPTERRWWRLLDDLPAALGQVHRWRERVVPPAIGDGGHLHANPTTVVCLAGVVRISAPRLRLDLVAGDALVIAPGVWHRHAPLRCSTVWFGQGFLATWSDVILGDDERCWTGQVPSQPSRRLCEQVLAEEDDERRRERFRALLAQVLAESVAHQAFAHPAMRAMLTRLWSGLHRGVTVTDVLRASGLSRAQAYRVFASGYGVPPKEALESARLWLAEELLTGGMSIGDIAEQCGFASPGTFTRAWKRTHVEPPRTSMLRPRRR